MSQAIGDADTMIVKQAIERGMKGEISAIVGEDTDLLVLMIALASDTVKMYTLIASSIEKNIESIAGRNYVMLLAN